MKRKILYFLFILCSVVLVNTVHADDSVNYKTYCKQYSDINERLNCCNQAGNESDINACKKPAFSVCTEKTLLTDREVCCGQITNETDRAACIVEANDTCSSTESVRLSKVASNVKITYEPYEYKPEGFDDENSENYSVIYYWMDIKIYNVTSEVRVTVNNGKNSYSVDINNLNDDGVIVLRETDTSAIKNYTFTIYASSSNCKSKKLRTIKLTLPKYNQYSNRAACADIPQYYLCHQYINFDVDAKNFLKNVENYKTKIEKNEIADTNSKKTGSTTRKLVKTVSDNKYLVIGGIIIIGCVITFIILRNKRRNG